VVVPAIAFALVSCKKSEPAPSDQTPAESASASGGVAPEADNTNPIPPVPAADSGVSETASGSASDMESVATSRGAAETTPKASARPGSREPASTAPQKPAPAKPAPAKPSAAKPVEPAPPAAAAPAAAPEASAPADTPPGGGQQAGGEQTKKASLDATPQVYEGWKHFSANCERCHGQDAVGSSFAPSLIKSIQNGSVLGTGPLTHEIFIGTVVAGRPAKGMPSWAQLLDKEKMENIWLYLSARASGQLAPGRPVKQGG
jgi:cytochrome c